MRIFSRYVFRQASGSFLLILISLTGVVWIALALRQFNVVTSQGQNTWMLIKMTSLAVPNLMAIIAPFSYLIAALGAQGTSSVHGVDLIERGYEGFLNKLDDLGAHVEALVASPA